MWGINMIIGLIIGIMIGIIISLINKIILDDTLGNKYNEYKAMKIKRSIKNG